MRSFFDSAVACSRLYSSATGALADEGLDDAIAALRAFALIDRETIVIKHRTGTPFDFLPSL
jgi:hypothetical protein